jgi:DNA-binding IclR family transcriptional regulator
MNGLQLLQVLADSLRPHSISELSRGTELPQSHIHRLMQTLAMPFCSQAISAI